MLFSWYKKFSSQPHQPFFTSGIFFFAYLLQFGGKVRFDQRQTQAVHRLFHKILAAGIGQGQPQEHHVGLLHAAPKNKAQAPETAVVHPETQGTMQQPGHYRQQDHEDQHGEQGLGLGRELVAHEHQEGQRPALEDG